MNYDEDYNENFNDDYDPDYEPDYDGYDPYENYSWEDSMMDALDGEPDAYWNID